MQRLQYRVHQIADRVMAERPPDDHQQHIQQLNGLLQQTAAQPTNAIPSDLLAQPADDPQLVGPLDIVHLQQANQIAQVVAQMLPAGAGNQRATVARSQGRSLVLSIGAQQLAKGRPDLHWRAATAVLTGAGTCDQYAALAFEIARGLDLPVAIVQDRRAGHTFALLYPDSASPVVIDAWTLFPSVCLLKDSPFVVNNRTCQHRPGDASAARFSLPAIAQIRQRVDAKVGVHAIENTVREQQREHFGVRSDRLDLLLHEQGLLHYHQLDRARMTAAQQSDYDTELPLVQQRVTDAMLRALANSVTASSVEGAPVQTVHQNGIGTAAQIDTATQLARLTARIGAREAARRDSRAHSFAQAQQDPSRQASVTRHCTRSHTVMSGLTVVTAESTITVATDARPAVWDRWQHARARRYCSPGGLVVDTAMATQPLIDAVATALHSAQQSNFPDGLRAAQPAASNAVPTVSDGALRQRCVASIAAALGRMESLRSTACSTARAHEEAALLQQIAVRVDDLSPALHRAVMARFTALLPGLQSENLRQGTQHWVDWQRGYGDGNFDLTCSNALRLAWAQCYADDALEAALRDAVCLSSPPAAIIDFIAMKLPLASALQGKLLNLLQTVLPTLTDTAQRDAALAPLRRAMATSQNLALRAATVVLLAQYSVSR